MFTKAKPPNANPKCGLCGQPAAIAYVCPYDLTAIPSLSALLGDSPFSEAFPPVPTIVGYSCDRCANSLRTDRQ